MTKIISLEPQDMLILQEISKDSVTVRQLQKLLFVKSQTTVQLRLIKLEEYGLIRSVRTGRTMERRLTALGQAHMNLQER